MSGVTVLASSIDYLIGMFTTAVAAQTFNGAGVTVYDGVSQLEPGEQNVVVIGGTDAPTAASAVRQFVATGFVREEMFTVNCYIRSSVGDTAAGTQKLVRDSAVSIFQAVENAILADLRLGGLLTSYPATISDQTFTQTIPDDQVARREARIDFGVLIRNRY